MECLDPEKIEGYVRDSLQAEEKAKIGKHIEECPKCKENISNALANESLLNEFHSFQFPTLSCTSSQPVVNQSSMTVAKAQEILKEQYTIVQKVGQGASGEVFQAIDTTLERPVAIKFFRDKTDIYEKYIKM